MQDGLADAPRGNWVDRHAPARLRPWLRLMRADRPIGWWLLLLPCLWGAALAAGVQGAAFPNPWHLFLFALGAFVMRSAGCIWNDYRDRDLDARVARTRDRPLASGAVRARDALAVAVGLSLIGFAILLQFNAFTIALGIASLGLVAVYPLLKRVTHFPQIVLGLAFNWGVLVGWAAVFGSLSWAPVLLYLAGVAWTFGYDTIYALQDREDDAVVGVKSTALYFGRHVRTAVIASYGAAILLAGAALMVAGATLPAFAGLCGFALLLGRQMARLRVDDPGSALQVFRRNRDTGLVLAAGLAADALVRSGVLGAGG